MGRTLIGIFLFTVCLSLFMPLFLHQALGDPQGGGEWTVEVYCHREKRTLNLGLEEYIKGVVAAEMGPRAPLEALKAQAVAARTYALYQKEDLCTSPDYSQAYYSPDELREKWGYLNFVGYWTRISTAVKETRGMIMVYEGEPILAVYHANSGGATESSEMVWGEPRPYLVSRDSSFEREEGGSREDLSFSLDSFARRLHLPAEEEINPVRISEKSSSGRVLELQAGDYTFSGREVREALELPSTLFVLENDQKRLNFTVWGRGHGVGMSQDGASGLAEKGYDFTQILAFYYPQISLNRLY